MGNRPTAASVSAASVGASRFPRIAVGAPKRALLTLAGALLTLAGCQPVSPIVPPDSSGPTSHGGYMSYSFQLAWDSTQFPELQSLSIRHPGNLTVTEQSGLDQILVSVDIDVQNESNAQLASAFQSGMTQKSTLIGITPSIQVPPSSGCAEQNQVIQGLCVRGFNLYLPTGTQLALDLSWSGTLAIDGSTVPKIALHLGATSQAVLQGTAAAVTLDGGAPDSGFELQNGAGSFAATLSQIQTLRLEQIKGAIAIALDQPKGAAVDVDGGVVTQFPYHRP